MSSILKINIKTKIMNSILKIRLDPTINIRTKVIRSIFNKIIIKKLLHMTFIIPNRRR